MKKVFFRIILLCAMLYSVSMAEEIRAESPAAAAEREETIVFPASGSETAPEADYISRKMPHRIRLRVTRLSGMRLSSPSRELYLALREEVTAVAAGEQASTIFEIPYGEVFQNTYTAGELGIESILDENRKITQEAKDAALAAMTAKREQVSGRAAIQCLVNDYPYELYWYNKSEGAGTKIIYRTTTYSATTSQISVNGTIIVQMTVSADYAAVSIGADGTAVSAEYEVDTGYGESVQAAARNAEQILNQAAGMDDYGKLCYFRDAICSLTDYNHEAVADKVYGDPWQLVWVFDGKPNTKVVCEGYAKAFQYLAGMATTEATVISVQGRIPAGAHMWNIVATHRHNYLVDLTNQDSGYDLFMKGYTSGDTDTGYTVDGGTSNIRYIYNERLEWSEAELTLSPFDYTAWKAAVEQAPEAEISHDTVYPGYAAAVRVIHEDGLFPATGMIIHGEAGANETEAGETGLISEAGSYTVSVIRDGVESSASPPIEIAVGEIPDGDRVRIPDGSVVESEAFAENPGITIAEAHNCSIQRDAFRDCEHLAMAIVSGCTIEDGGFPEWTLLCTDRIETWDGNRFLIRIAEE